MEQISSDAQADFRRNSELLRQNLQYCIDDRFMTQEQADMWFAKWCLENNPEMPIVENDGT